MLMIPVLSTFDQPVFLSHALVWLRTLAGKKTAGCAVLATDHAVYQTHPMTGFMAILWMILLPGGCGGAIKGTGRKLVQA